LVLWVMDAAAPDMNLPPELQRLQGAVLGVFNKVDLLNANLSCESGDKLTVRVSTLTGVGLADLEARIAAVARERTRGGEGSLITSARHRQHILAAAAAAEAYLGGGKDALELRAEDLRCASQAMGRLVGRVDAEEILGEIFGRFCIGK
jgi:tRNA modification GTPase